jgi:hypothetical protein
MKKPIWLILFSLIFLAGCQSSRFMQDDMYFTSYDAIREVRQFEVAQREKQELAQKRDRTQEKKEEVFVPNGTTLEDYYDFSYTARLRRFNSPNNSWAYYDPYFTNYYWFNNSNSQYFGNSVYSTYSWWGNNFANNYNSNYWVGPITSRSASGNWINPWQNNLSNAGWRNPYNQFTFNGWNKPNISTISWNNNFCFNNMYYNSKDNNCYWWWSNTGKAPGLSKVGNFTALMQKNGITNDVIKRPDINYTQIRADYELSIANADKKDSLENIIPANTNNSSLASKNSNVRNSNGNKNSNTSNNTTTNTTNTSKRWDNYNADVNISPNSDKDNSNSNWSKSGVFSEGSRNNNYQFNGTVIQKKNKNEGQDGSQTIEKAPNRK